MDKWDWVKCQDLIDVRDGTHDTPKYLDAGIPFITSKNISNGYIDFSDVEYISEEDHIKFSKRSKVEKGDVLFAMIGTVGNPVLVTTDIEFSIKNVALFKFGSSNYDASFFCYFLQSPQALKQFDDLSKGGIQKFVSLDVLRNLQIPLLDFEEQRRIAGILDQADRLRRLRRHARQLTDSFLQSVFIEMFAGSELQNWDTVTVEEISTYMRTGPFGSQLLHSEFVDSGIAVLGIDNAVKNYFSWNEQRYITPHKYDELKRYTVQPEDVLITIMGTCGRCAVVPHDIPVAINTKHLCCITLDKIKCLPTYLHACFLNHPIVLSQLGISQRGAIMDGLNMGIIKELKIPLPPLPVQEKYEQITNKYQHLFQQQQEAERQAELNFQALLHRAFTGQLSHQEVTM